MEDREPERYYDWMLWALRQERKKKEEPDQEPQQSFSEIVDSQIDKK